MILDEERFGRLLADLADEHQPSADGLVHIRSELARRRGRRRTLLVAAAVVVVLGSATTIWRLETRTQRSTPVKVGGAPTSLPPRPSGPTPTTSPRVSTYQPLIARFTGPASGWILANNPRLALFHTADGDSTWVDVLPPSASGNPNSGPNGFYALDDRHAWLSMWTTNGSTIFASSDGGVTWTAAPISGGATQHFSFIDPSHGWDESSSGAATGSEGVDILETADGRHWQLISHGVRPDGTYAGGGGLRAGCDKTGITFENATTGFATGVCSAGQLFDVTRDGGHTWQPLSLAWPNGSPGETEPPVFTGNRGAANAIDFQRFVYTTADGGRSWRTVALPAEPRTAVDILDASHWWFTDGTTIFSTRDAGAHWATTRPNIPFLVNDLQLVSIDAGWALVGDNSILRTSDAGHTWTTSRLVR